MAVDYQQLIDYSGVSDDVQTDINPETQTKIRRKQRYTVRVQAQGGGLQKAPSPLDRDRPVKASEVIANLYRLKAMLSRSELKQRDKAFEKAEVWINRVAATGGISVNQNFTFHNPGVSPSRARVDIEIIRGPLNLVL